jgi:membrane-associated phospholipid phosphatase
MPKKKAKKLAKAEHKASAKAAKHRKNPLVAIPGLASEAADQPPIAVLAAGSLALGLAMRNPAMTRTGARMLAAHVIATGLKTLLKSNVDRARPSRAIEKGHKLKNGHGAEDTTLNSFPSGHTAGAVVAAESIAAELPAAALPARLAAGAVGAVQLPRGAHYMSDVLAGAAIGWLSERLADAALDAGERALGRALAARREDAALVEAEAHPS